MVLIDHGLSNVFSAKAKKRMIELENGKFEKQDSIIKVGYSGNLSIPFLDRPTLKTFIEKYPFVEFYFFGNYKNQSDLPYSIWLESLKGLPNVTLAGQLTTEDLANEIFNMDILLLCYKPSHNNCIAENSHKTNEYLSTGAPFVSTYIEVLKDNAKVYVCEKNKNDQLLDQFEKALQELREDNKEKRIRRIEYALTKEYNRLIEML